MAGIAIVIVVIVVAVGYLLIRRSHTNR